MKITESFLLFSKIFCFIIFFLLLSCGTAFLIKDDIDSYTRKLSYEFYNQDKIDIAICGASHVSHGINTQISDSRFNRNTFNLGTPAQGLDSTYYIIKQAIKSYDVKSVFVELDFAILSGTELPKDRTGFKSHYLAGTLIKDPLLKFNYYKNISNPKYYLNSFLPIGKDKLLNLNPVVIEKKIKSIIDGTYYNIYYENDDSEYIGKGCVLDKTKISDGTFCYNKNHSPINITNVHLASKLYIANIIKLCEKNNIELTFYAMPSSDFYLNDRGNYDEYYHEVKSFLNSAGYEYYDFNLCKEEYLRIFDHEFFDDNHLNKEGIEKCSNFFCDFFLGVLDKNDVFYNSYAEKMNAQEERILGLIVKLSNDKKSVEISPVKNHKNFDCNILYSVTADINGKSLNLLEKSTDTVVLLPESSNGKLKIQAYLHDSITNEVDYNFVSF